MVLLGASFALLKWFRPRVRIVRGHRGVKDLLPFTVIPGKKKRRGRSPAPGFKKTYQSVLLGRRVNVRATLGTQRAIDRAGGFDRFIYYSPEEKLKSTLAISLKRRMNDLVTRYPSIEPPPLDKRNPKPLPKKLSVKIKPVEVCDMTKYVYLG